MIINSVKLQNFRNYKNAYAKLQPGLNVFVGNNAQGKTNLIESIYVAGIGKSNRAIKDKELIFWSAERAKINIVVTREFNKTSVEVVLSNNSKKMVKINDIPIKRIGELMGEVPIVYFSPDEIGLVKDGPADRRRFMDIDISQLNKTYFYLLCRYDKILNERNKYLKQARDFSALKDNIIVWDMQLSDVASKIIMCRVAFIESLKQPAKNVHSYITDNKENLEIEYAGLTAPTQEKLKEIISKKLSDTLSKDFELGYTSVGPHRDDIKMTINGIDIRTYGSQGQQRLSTLSLKIAELKVFKDERGEQPVLLLDDVLSELDEDRKIRLLKCTATTQTIITCTKFNYANLFKNVQIFNINNGTISIEKTN